MTLKKMALGIVSMAAMAHGAYAQDAGDQANEEKVREPSRWDQSGYYSVGYINSGMDFNDINLDVTYHMLSASLGYDFNKYFGLEAEMAIGLNRESFGRDLDGGLVNAGAYAIAAFPVGNNFRVFGRAGYGVHEINFSSDSFPDDVRYINQQYGFIVGGGVDVAMTDNMDLRLNYMSYAYDESDTTSFAATLVFRQ